MDAVICETAAVRAAFWPELGAKLTSLVGVKNGREYLEQDPGTAYRKPVYGGDYVAAECSAFDDMFPTIDAVICNEHPWKGVELPDHGEVYALKWEWEVLDDVLHMWVYSVRFGYRLDKWVEEQDGALHIRYQVQNLTDFDFNCIYAAHCMVAAEKGVVLEVPYEAGAAVTTIFSESGRIGKYSSKAAWPVHEGLDLSVFPGDDERDAYKYFFDEPAPEGKCVCRYPDGSALHFGFDCEAMPWLGVWTNPGGFKGLHNIALEPCTGAFDRPDVAKLHGKHSILKAKQKKDWYVSFLIK